MLVAACGDGDVGHVLAYGGSATETETEAGGGVERGYARAT